MLNFWNIVLGKTYTLSNHLQKESIDLNSAIEQTDSCAIALKDLRSEEGFNDIEASAKEQAKECDTSTEFQEVRVRMRKCFADELATDEPIPDSRRRFKVETFYYILDVFDQQFVTCFADLRNTAAKFQVLSEKKKFS